MQLRNISAILIILLLSLPLCAAAQEDGEEEEVFVEPRQQFIDSLLSLIKPDTPDSTKALYYSVIGGSAVSPDTIVKYANMSLSLLHDSYSLYHFYMGANYNNLGTASHYNGDLKTEIEFYKKSINHFLQSPKPLIAGIVYRNIGSTFDDLNNLDSMLYYMNKALEIGRRQNDTSFIAGTYRYMSEIYSERNFYQEADNYLRQALVLDSLAHDIKNYSVDLSALAQSIISKNNSNTAELLRAKDCIVKAMSVLDTIEIDDKYFSYGTASQIYIRLAQLTNKTEYADSCLFFYKKAAPYMNARMISSNNVHFRLIYIDYLMFYKKYNEAKQALLDIKKLFTEDTPAIDHENFHKKLKNVYIELGDYKNAYEQQEKEYKYSNINLNDSTMSVLSDAKAQQAILIEKIEQEKKEEIYAADKRRLNTQRIALVCGLILVTLVIIYMHRAYNIKRRANKDLSEKNEILNSQKAEIMAQRDELASQRDEIMAQRDEIASQKDIITQQWHEVETVNQKLFSSINYARRIQRAAVSSEEDVHRIFPDSFVFYRPRDIVSGDFYRCGRCGKYSVMITADCTGHGIPGAFLSMLGLSALKEYMVTEFDAETPGTVLDRIRDFIKTTLSATDNGSNVSDGMDMTICCYDYEKMDLRYASANQKFYIIRDGKFIKLKGDNMPVGRFIRELPHFTTHTIPIQKGDMIYTFSDGIQDQLGIDPNGDTRKFTSLQLLETLLSFADKPAATQCQLLEKAILDWRGNTPQVDDMTLVGVRV